MTMCGSILDIACMDQKREDTKMQEIGKQANIFKTARQACIWLELEVIGRHIQTLMYSAN